MVSRQTVPIYLVTFKLPLFEICFCKDYLAFVLALPAVANLATLSGPRLFAPDLI